MDGGCQKRYDFYMASDFLKIDPHYQTVFDIRPQKGDLKKFAIIEEAIRQLTVHGIEKTNFATIAKSLKTIRAHVAYYFASMDDLFDAVLKYALSTGQRITVKNIEEADGALAKVQAVASSVFDWAETYPEHVKIFILFQHMATVKPKLRELNSEIRRIGRARVLEIFQKHKKGAGRSRAEIERKTHAIQNLILGNLTEYFTADSPYSLSKHREHTLAEVGLLCAGWI
jgi:AcrR family transcriptional regulator